MYAQQLFSLEDLENCFKAIEHDLIRFPSIDSDVLKNRVETFIKQMRGNRQ